MLKLLILFTFSVSLSFAGPREEAQNILQRYEAETSPLTRLELMSREFIGLPYGKAALLVKVLKGNMIRTHSIVLIPLIARLMLKPSWPLPSLVT